MRRRAFLTGIISMAPAGAVAQTVTPLPTALSGDRFSIGDTEYALADVMAPPLYTLASDAPAYFETSRQALQTKLKADLETKNVLSPTRWNVRRVQARPPGGELSLQEMLVMDGAVRVAPQSDEHEFIKRLLMFEEAARNARKGLWGLPAYRIHDAANAISTIGAYHLIEGVVRRAEQFGARFYLNFGDDFRTDFTAGARSVLYRRWARDGFDLKALNAAQIRVRGFVNEINGPSIDLQHSLQIERLA